MPQLQMTKRIGLASAALASTLPAELTPDPHVGGHIPHQPPPHRLRSVPASRGQRVSSRGEPLNEGHPYPISCCPQ